MKSVSDSTALERLVHRLKALRPDTPRKWGTLTAGEMLCHLGDATTSVMTRGAAEAGDVPAEAPVSRPIVKWIALRSPLPWPQGLPTPANVDPRAAAPREPGRATSRPTGGARSPGCGLSRPPRRVRWPRATAPSAA